MNSFAGEVWATLSAIDCSQHVEKKMNLSYLSWAWAWATLMKHYPESNYLFESPSQRDDGTVEVWVAVNVSKEGKSLARRMWLPVMDHKNNAIPNPTTRHISDTRMRCLTKCLAMFGLGHYIYAGEDIPSEESVKGAEQMKYKALCEKHQDSIIEIKKGIESGDLSSACEAYEEIPKDDVMELWKAPTKGGVFTTKEREIMKSKEFREAYFGPSNE